MYTWYLYLRNFGRSSIASLRTRTVRTFKEVDRGRLFGHSRRSLGSIRAVCRAWRALKVLRLTGVDKTISRVFFFERFLVPGTILHFSKCWCFLLIRISLKTARLVTILGLLCRDRFGVHYHPSLGALRAVCRVSRMHVPRVMPCFFSPKKENRPPVQIAWVQLFEFEDASSSPGKRSFFFFVCLFSLFPICFTDVGVFFQNVALLICISLWNCTVRHNSCLPCAGTGC